MSTDAIQLSHAVWMNTFGWTLKLKSWYQEREQFLQARRFNWTHIFRISRVSCATIINGLFSILWMPSWSCQIDANYVPNYEFHPNVIDIISVEATHPHSVISNLCSRVSLQKYSTLRFHWTAQQNNVVFFEMKTFLSN